MEALESALGHSFQNKPLLTMALTHGSVGYEAQKNHADNQRLEFLGDAVLQLVLSEMLYLKLPESDEGKLTKLRARMVSSKALAARARQLHLGSYLIMGRGEEANGGRQRESSLADVMEAVIGALYLDAGLAKVQSFIRQEFGPVLELHLLSPQDENPKGQLQEILQALGPTPPQYRVTQETGPAHAKHFEVSVLWLGQALAAGSGRTKKEAETEAARKALELPELERDLKYLASQNIKPTKTTENKCGKTGHNFPQL